MAVKQFLTSVWGIVAGVVIIVLLGSGVGYFLVFKRGTVAGTVAPGAKVTTSEVGINDTSAFPDSAKGVIQKGGLGSEGTHQLVREGGPSQTVYLVSSVVDLDQFEGKKVEIWGQTFKAQKAAWLMDVGLVKILD